MILWTLTTIFIFVMLSVGFWGMRKTRTLGDFFIGGRSIGPWVSAFAYGTSYYSAVMFIGFAGKLGWGFGLNVLWTSLGNTLLGCLLAWFVLGYRTRRMTQNLGVMTMPEFFDRRFDAPNLKIFCAIIIFLFLLPYSASVFQGLGYLFQITMGLDYTTALIFMSIITAIYLIMGGYFAVTLNDFLQGIIMLIGSVVMFFILTNKSGGLMATIQTIQTNYPQNVKPLPPWYMVASVAFMTSFGVWGLPQMIQKFYSIKDEKQILRAAIVTTGFSFVVVFAAYFMGSMTHVFYVSPETAVVSSVAAGPTIVGETDATGRVQAVPAPTIEKNGKQVIDFDRLIPDLLKHQLPEALMAVIVLLVLSASMSTLSSLILVASSAIAIDLYKDRAKLDDSSDKPLVLIRFLSGLFILISFLIAMSKFDVIVTLMSVSWGAVAGAFMAPYLYALYWRRLTKWGALSGMITGLAVSIGLLIAWGPDYSPLSASLAMLIPFVVIPPVSLLTQPPRKELVDLAFAKKADFDALSDSTLSD
ncbi:MAG: sodium/solute symporter [Planctomycetia bacterium]|nr:sodium/solute symporter [Planctomycetia bacterium]